MVGMGVQGVALSKVAIRPEAIQSVIGNHRVCPPVVHLGREGVWRECGGRKVVVDKDATIGESQSRKRWENMRDVKKSSTTSGIFSVFLVVRTHIPHVVQVRIGPGIAQSQANEVDLLLRMRGRLHSPGRCSHH